MDHKAVTAATENQPVKLSFEFFPPRTDKMQQRFWQTVERLQVLRPDFFSITYGALGSGQQQSLNTVTELGQKCEIPIAAHLTCVDATREELNKVVDNLHAQGVKHIVALRGDTQDENQPFLPANDCYQSSIELIEALAAREQFRISVAAYPEPHPESKSQPSDIEYLKQKFAAGADEAVTQYFFDPDVYLRFRDAAVAAGINKPLIPGILPIHNYEKVVAFSARCGASVPEHYASLYSKLHNDPSGAYQLSIDLALNVCKRLQKEGVDQFHFYTLNQTDLSYAVCKELLGGEVTGISTEFAA